MGLVLLDQGQKWHLTIKWRKSVRTHVSDALVLGGNLANWSKPKEKQEESTLITYFFFTKDTRKRSKDMLQFTTTINLRVLPGLWV